MNKITINNDKISKSLELKLCVTEENYNIELIDIDSGQSVVLQEMSKNTSKIEEILEIYNEFKSNIIKEKYKDFKEIYIKKYPISNRKELYLKSGILYYEIGYRVQEDVAMGLSVVKEQVIERESKFDISLDTALSRYNELKVKLCDSK